MLTDSNQTSGPPANDLDDASGVDERDGERHRHVHAEPSRRDESFRAGEERRRRIEHDGRRREQRQPAEQVARGDVDAVECAEPQRARVHHRLHRTEAGDGEALQRIARFAAARVVERRAVERQRPIADASERVDDPRERERLCRRYTMRARCAPAFTPTSTTPGKPREGSLDQPAAGGATHAVDQHDRLACSVGERAHDSDATARGRRKAAALLRRSPRFGRPSGRSRCAIDNSRRVPAPRSTRPRRDSRCSTRRTGYRQRSLAADRRQRLAAMPARRAHRVGRDWAYTQAATSDAFSSPSRLRQAGIAPLRPRRMVSTMSSIPPP